MSNTGEHPQMQMSLGIVLRDGATFENFYHDENRNALALATLQGLQSNDESCYLLWGESGCGLTHLMNACCHRFQHEATSMYIPVAEVRGYDPFAIFEGLHEFELICIDGIDLIFGQPEWEQALFHLYNNVKDTGKVLILSCHQSPATAPIQLPDLQSRLLASTIFQIRSLDDEGKQKALQLRAQGRGLVMSDDVAKFVITRASRDTNALFNLLGRLDDASLVEQRKLTIPFVKEVLGF